MLRAFIVGRNGARIGVAITATDMGHTVRIAMAMERTNRTRMGMGTERTSRIALTDTARIDLGSDPAMGHTRISRGLDIGTGTSRGGRAEPTGRSVGSGGPSSK